VAFFNSELRWQLGETHNTFIPIKIGIRTFFDTGRVWADEDNAYDIYWHTGYGGGIYLAPFREQFAFNLSASSSKEESFLIMFSIGTFFK
jgi:outer membrane translocation and assembly module TamA